MFLKVNLLIFSLVIGSYSFGTVVGQKKFDISDTSRKRNLKVTVWYPANSKSKSKPINPRGPFKPVVAAVNAEIEDADHKYPIVFLSHGSGGKADKLFWIAEHLVKSNIIVIAPNHPGNMTGDNSAHGVLRIWDRAKDISFLLDNGLSRTGFLGQLDRKRVSVVGHSAGGSTALLLAGARFSKSKFSSPFPKCQGTKDPYYAKLCSEMKSLDFNAYSKNIVEANYQDTRIKSAVSFDPGFGRSFNVETTSRIGAPTLVLIADKLASPHDEIHSKEFLKIMAKGSARIVPESIHMSFLQPCKSDFQKDAELKELCAGSSKKVGMQNKIAAQTVEFIKRNWTSKKAN